MHRGLLNTGQNGGTKVTQLFYLATFQERNWIIDHITASGAPVLNDIKGDLVHTSLEAAERLALDIASDVEVANKGMDIFVLDVPENIYDSLRRCGEISEHNEPDAFGAVLMRVSAQGANIINGFCDFDTVRRFIPEEVYLALCSMQGQNLSRALN